MLCASKMSTCSHCEFDTASKCFSLLEISTLLYILIREPPDTETVMAKRPASKKKTVSRKKPAAKKKATVKKKVTKKKVAAKKRVAAKKKPAAKSD